MGEFQLEVLLRKPGWETQLCLGIAELAAGEQGCFVYIISPNLAMCNIPKGPNNYIFRLCFSSHFPSGKVSASGKSIFVSLGAKIYFAQAPKSFASFCN